uniref:Uncharacterized protein n=1 Tax=Leptospira ellisii TaxID=2023197 RepID=A0A2N0B7F4_9LEPT|nr:hypothetical protein CH379_13075 [Leptospira ellisii]
MRKTGSPGIFLLASDVSGTLSLSKIRKETDPFFFRISVVFPRKRSEIFRIPKDVGTPPGSLDFKFLARVVRSAKNSRRKNWRAIVPFFRERP